MERLPPALTLDVLVHRAVELLGRSPFTPIQLAAGSVIADNAHAVLPLEPVSAAPEGMLDTITAASDDVVRGTLLATGVTEYQASIDGLVASALDAQREVWELARVLPRSLGDQTDTRTVVATLGNSELLRVSGQMNVFLADLCDLDSVRSALTSVIDRRRSLAVRIKRLGFHAGSSREEVARSVRAAVSSARMTTGSVAKSVESVAALVRSNARVMVRRGAYETLARAMVAGEPLPAGLPRPIETCARRVIYTEHVRRCSQWSARSNTCARSARIYITADVAIDILGAVLAEERDEDGRYIVDRKPRESRLLGVSRNETAQAQILMEMFDVARFKHIETHGTESSETWIPRAPPDVISAMVRDLRDVIRSRVLPRCSVTKGAPLRDICGHVHGEASQRAIESASSEDGAELPSELDGLWRKDRCDHLSHRADA